MNFEIKYKIARISEGGFYLFDFVFDTLSEAEDHILSKLPAGEYIVVRAFIKSES